MMLARLKMAMLERGVRQTRMAVALGWDPAKLSRIVNEITVPTSQDRAAIAQYLGVSESELFGGAGQESRTTTAPKVA